jgi:hypothetical protein
MTRKHMANKAVSEKEIENDILTFLKWKGIFAWNNQSTGIFDPTKKTFRKKSKHQLNGVSDILGIIDGKMLAIEVKKPTLSKKTNLFIPRTQDDLAKKASEDQILFVNNVKCLGGIAFYADTLDVVKEQLNIHLSDTKPVKEYI